MTTGLLARMFVPISVFMTDDGGEVVIRDYAGQSGRFCVMGPYTCDIEMSFKTLTRAKWFVEDRFGPGKWTEGK